MRSHQHHFRPLETLTATGSVNAKSVHQAPRQNGLLAALPQADYARLLPHLAPIRLAPGSVLHEAGEPERHVYFICEGIVSRYYVMKDGTSTGVAIIGNEGVAGIASFLGGESTPCEAMVLSSGYAYRLNADVLRSELKHGGALLHLLLQYAMALIVQTGQGAMCCRHHSLEQRMCGFTLLCLDRLRSSEMAMTQELIAHVLGVRREGVTVAARNLQGEGLIRCGRGHITVLDRHRLEARACECHGVVAKEYQRLLSQSSCPESGNERNGHGIPRHFIDSVSHG